MTHDGRFLDEHWEMTRRYFLQRGVAGAAAMGTPAAMGTLAGSPLSSAAGGAGPQEEKPKAAAKPEKAGARSDPYFTPPENFRDVSRGSPIPHTLSEEKKSAAGLTRETWKLEVISDPEHPAKLGKEFKKSDGSALDFEQLMQLAKQHVVRFPKVMTCLNLGCPLGMGLWEGVPLREVIWLATPRENLRRVFYYGFHNDDPKQLFRSSLPIGRVLEDPFDLPPVILCTKLNGEWLDSERGGPVRVIVPEAYGFKSVKWLTHVVLSNLAHANDTYAEQNNDIDSPLKTFSATLSIPRNVKVGEPIPVSGYAQVGISGLSKVQVAIEPASSAEREGDPYFTEAPWVDAEILPPPEHWAGLAGGKIPADTHGFGADGRPKSWPLRLTNAHWAIALLGLPEGEYIFRSRTIDEKGHAQPMPRPFRKSGHAQIESLTIHVQPEKPSALSAPPR